MASYMTKTYELSCQYDARKSFYGKAKVKIKEDLKMLFSYDIEVCKIQNNQPKIMIDNITQTTLRHIKEFLKQNGFFADTKKQIISDYK